jgi:cytochrome c-type biogenesis protein CcmF
MLLANNVLLVVAMGTVMLGTLYPLALDALGLGKISVGPPYFEAVFVPLVAPALFLMGAGPIARWKQASLPELAVRLRWALAVSFATAALLPLAFGRWSALVGFGLFLAVWILASAAVSLRERLRHASGAAGIRARLATTPRAFYGMLLAHVGVAVFVVGVTLVKGYESEKDVRMAPGDFVELAGYTFRMGEVSEVKGPNYVAMRAAVEVARNGETVTRLYPEKRRYLVQDMVMTEAAIAPGFARDLYVSLGDQLDASTWLVRVQHKPFVSWIWAGALLMALGGALAAADRRYRVAARAHREQSAATAAPPDRAASAETT